MKNAVPYKDGWLMKGSKAYELYENWKKGDRPPDKKLLDDHMKDVDQRYKQILAK
jgi:hypothetical protein